MKATLKKWLSGCLILLSLILLSSCRTIGVHEEWKPVPEQCDKICRTPCELDPSIRFVPPAEDTRAFDTLVEQVVIPLRSEFDRCETHRLACVQCLDRLNQAGVTKKDEQR